MALEDFLGWTITEIDLLKDVTDLIKEETESPMDFQEKLFGSIPWMIVTLMQLRQPKNVVKQSKCFHSVADIIAI